MQQPSPWANVDFVGPEQAAHSNAQPFCNMSQAHCGMLGMGLEDAYDAIGTLHGPRLV